ncbi:hypothetical protein DUNSADRAFT_13864 [Dunaliella salina]|uniref:Uncharacterized protein n=1 Tax=Dunaliella salina TaxID=3046 RepID=A0ABQ7H2X6_DUNSA|nr:hypothetical protein DUNSADRAFT_13864 [Dunaliella salina]|eukprot:KAF5841220.1 hypothetical protein DUNSADRAFT_13864 [Dunaliella salina]
MEAAVIRSAHAGAGGCDAQDVHIVWVSEYHTSKHCFRCGAETTALIVGREGRQHRSTRLRACAQCSSKLQERRNARAARGQPQQPRKDATAAMRPWTVDRDVQGAFNIAYIGLAWLMKHPRPYHLSTPDVQERWRALGWVS